MATQQRNWSILLLDNDEDDRLFFSECNVGVNCSINTCKVEEGLILLSTGEANPDIIFIDIFSPDLKAGLGHIEKIREMPALVAVPVVIYTDSIDPFHMAETEKLGVAKYMVKPSSIPEIGELVANTLQELIPGFSA